jgi:hypothetical protein
VHKSRILQDDLEINVCMTYNIAFLHKAVQHSPHCSSRKLLEAVNIKRTTLQTMRDDLHMFSYKIHVRRSQFQRKLPTWRGNPEQVHQWPLHSECVKAMWCGISWSAVNVLYLFLLPMVPLKMHSFQDLCLNDYSPVTALLYMYFHHSVHKYTYCRKCQWYWMLWSTTCIILCPIDYQKIKKFSENCMFHLN